LDVMLEIKLRVCRSGGEVSRSLNEMEYFQHVKECCLPGIIEAEKEQLSVFVEKTKRCKNIPEPPRAQR